MEEVGVLVHDRHQAAQRLRIERADVLATHSNCAGLRIEQAQQEPRDRGFSGTARADDADLLARGDGKGEAVMRRLPPAGIGEMHVFEGDCLRPPYWDRGLLSVSRRAGRISRARRPQSRRHQRLGGEQRVNSGRRRLPDRTSLHSKRRASLGYR